MKITQNKMVSIHYTLKDDNGNELDSSIGREPLTYLHGNGYLIVGLENALEGKDVGEKISTVIQPKDGYGEYDPQLIIEVDRNQFDFDGEIKIGMKFQVMTAQGLSLVTVKEINGDKIKIDGNHELTGKVLHFDVEVVEIREPTEEELNPHYGCGGCSGNCGNCGGDCDGECDGNCDCENGGDCNCSK